MINSIDPNEFLTMIPTFMMDELRSHSIDDNTIILVCQFLNDIRAGVPRINELYKNELSHIIVTNNRLTTTDGKSKILRQGDRLNMFAGDWTLDMTGKGVNYIQSENGKFTWHLQKDEGKRYPKGYKLFMKFYFSNFHLTSINKIDMFYDDYVRTYNELYQKALDEQVN